MAHWIVVGAEDGEWTTVCESDDKRAAMQDLADLLPEWGELTLIEERGLITEGDTFADFTGARVELPPHHGAWMQGDRYGTVLGMRHDMMERVKLDKSGREVVVLLDECKIVRR